MEILTAKTARRSTRLRVQIPITVTSLDRIHPFAEQCVVLVVSPQGCGMRSTHALPLKTPVLLADLPGGMSTSGHVASCLPLGSDGKSFLIGIAFYNQSNVWGIADPPADWNSPSEPHVASAASPAKTPVVSGRNTWPYNLLSSHGQAHPKGK
jgi:hypothetical protein